MDKPRFFSLDLKQPVNQWLCIALMGVMCFWVVIYYFVNQTEAVGNAFVQVTMSGHGARHAQDQN